MSRRPWLAAAVGCLVTALLAPAALAGKGDSSVTIVNKSKWDIHHLFVSSSDDEEWGSDQLGEHILETGGSFTLHSIPCDIYDVKLVDEDDDECEVLEVKLCADEEQWVITNKDLLECEGWE